MVKIKIDIEKLTASDLINLYIAMKEEEKNKFLEAFLADENMEVNP